ncbi:MAG: 30S ribosomal protein S15 [Coriobacteriia bacterium]|nr:30S ribosomal protein S15 [Coriobacteriia bacterium]MBS5478511.1 30S ribosomal protein S15 [Coriobacteriia bacterium]
MVTKEQRAAIVKEFGKDEHDTGSARVQVALLTARIKELTEHMKSHHKDFHSRRGLLMLVGQRRRLLVYIRDNDINEYRELIAKLGIRDNIK